MASVTVIAFCGPLAALLPFTSRSAPRPPLARSSLSLCSPGRCERTVSRPAPGEAVASLMYISIGESSPLSACTAAKPLGLPRTGDAGAGRDLPNAALLPLLPPGAFAAADADACRSLRI